MPPFRGLPAPPPNHTAAEVTPAPAPWRKAVRHNKYRLTTEILALSEATGWDLAKEEWDLADLFRAGEDEPGRCLCGRFPIYECCVIRNRETGHKAMIGNVCVRKFLGLPADKIFAGMNRIARKLLAAMTSEALAFARERSWVNDREFEFYADTARRRSLTAKQSAYREAINRRVLERFRVYRGTVA
jgi:hypothetical protein